MPNTNTATICRHYGDCTVTPQFCAKRFKKAEDSPDESALDYCRDCKRGAKAYKELGSNTGHGLNNRKRHLLQKKAGSNNECRDIARKTKAPPESKLCGNGFGVAPYPKSNPRIKSSEGPTYHKQSCSPLPVEPSEPAKGSSLQAGDRTAIIAQLLYSSELLDEQINGALDAGVLDTKVLIDIRFRIGNMLRESLGRAEIGRAHV